MLAKSAEQIPVDVTDEMRDRANRVLHARQRDVLSGFRPFGRTAVAAFVNVVCLAYA